MSCDWCNEEATKAGRRPARTQGPDYVKSCSKHVRLIKLLEYDETDISEVEDAEKKAKRK